MWRRTNNSWQGGLSDTSVIMEVDHRGIGVTYKPTFKIIKGRSYSHYDKGKFIKDLQDTNWHCMVEERNTTEKWCKFKNIFIDVCDVHAPMKDIKNYSKKTKMVNK